MNIRQILKKKTVRLFTRRIRLDSTGTCLVKFSQRGIEFEWTIRTLNLVEVELQAKLVLEANINTACDLFVYSPTKRKGQ